MIKLLSVTHNGCGIFYQQNNSNDTNRLNLADYINFRSKSMQELSIVINNKVGLHARPAALFVQAASKFKSDINISCHDPKEDMLRTANAKSILGILTLGVFQGMEIHIKAEGDDEQEAIKALGELVESNFGEP
jgi:phosphocarrier protein